MKKIPKSVWILLGLVATIYAAWSIAYPSTAVRYRMTVTLETPEGIKTGSAVREVAIEKSPQFLGSTSVGAVGVTRGEAVIVDLGKHGVLFALMRGGVGGIDYGGYILTTAFPSGNDPFSREGIGYYRSLKNAKTTLTPQQYPMFVRFRDLNDPKTVEAISQYNDRDMPTGYGGMAKTAVEVFGAGIKLKEVTIEITRDSVTTGIEKLLPWLPQTKGYISGQFLGGAGLLNQLDKGDFYKGSK